MTAPAAKRAHTSALDAAVSTLEVPGLSDPGGLLVLANGNCLVSTLQHKMQLLTPSGQLAIRKRGRMLTCDFSLTCMFGEKCMLT